MATGRITTSQGIGCGEGREAGRLRAAQTATELNLMGAVFRAEGEWQAADMARERGPPFLLATCVSPDRLAGGRLEQAESGDTPFLSVFGVLRCFGARLGTVWSEGPCGPPLTAYVQSEAETLWDLHGRGDGQEGAGTKLPFLTDAGGLGRVSSFLASSL